MEESGMVELDLYIKNIIYLESVYVNIVGDYW